SLSSLSLSLPTLSSVHCLVVHLPSLCSSLTLCFSLSVLLLMCVLTLFSLSLLFFPLPWNCWTPPSHLSLCPPLPLFLSLFSPLSLSLSRAFSLYLPLFSPFSISPSPPLSLSLPLSPLSLPPSLSPPLYLS